MLNPIRKAQPTQSDVHIDAVLTNISVAYIQNAANFVAGRVFPMVPVQKQSDKYFIYTKNDWFRDEAKKRADSTESEGSGYNLSTDNYFADVWAFHKDVGSQVRANSDAPLNPDRDATEFVTQRLMLREEIQWATDYFGTGIWGTDVTPANLWNNYSTSDPINDVETGKEVMLGNTGFEPNTLVLGYKVARQLKHHPDLVDRIKYSGGKIVTEEIMAQLFGVERVLVCKGVKATNIEGETAAMDFIQGKHALLAYVNPSPSLLQPSAGYRFTWTAVSAGLGQSIGINRFYMQHLKCDRIEGEIAFDDKVVASDLGYFFNGAVA